MSKPAKQGKSGRNAKGQFKPGTTGNPNGRRPKALATVEKLRTALADELPGVIDVVVRKARDGDTSAAKLILERVLPPLKATELPALLDGMTGTRTEQGDAIFRSMAEGILAPGQAAQLLAALAAQAKLAEVDEIERRLAAIEQRMAGGTSA